jgi:hypothetical protein
MDWMIMPYWPVSIEDGQEHRRGECENEKDATGFLSDFRRKEINDVAPGLFSSRVRLASHALTIASTKSNQQGKKNW